MIAHDIVIRPVITEKSMLGAVNKLLLRKLLSQQTRLKLQKLVKKFSALRLQR